MTKNIKLYLSFLALQIVIFSLQTYMVFEKKIPKYLVPVEDHKVIYMYYNDAFYDLWVDMLGWPACLFGILLTGLIVEISKATSKK